MEKPSWNAGSACAVFKNILSSARAALNVPWPAPDPLHGLYQGGVVREGGGRGVRREEGLEGGVWEIRGRELLNEITEKPKVMAFRFIGFTST